MEQGPKVVILVLLLGGLGYASYKTFGPQSTEHQLAEAGAPACPNGVVACPNNCLKRETEGWRPMHVDGHPDTDIWFTFVDARGRRQSFNQGHIGHVIQVVNGQHTDTGVCPVCGGTTRVCK